MGRAYIFGAGGHARVIASFLDADVIFLVPGEASAPNQMRQQDYLDHYAHGNAPVYIGVGNNADRAKIFERLSHYGKVPSICIAPNAWVAKDADIGPGAVICAGAIIGTRAKLGANTIVNTLSSVDHDCVIGDHTQITAGVTIAGSVQVGSHCFFGIKSAVIPGCKLGHNVSVMAGSVVVKDCVNSVLLGGTPAKVMREL